ncbi:TPA: extensin [Burkholderia aenigmatica]|uniref:extensin n=1 Tax=Burkholderia sp. AU45251 TaxID=3059204 RepID=UPI00264B45B9|nr:extensin [Burkholderia sp. AU45251]HDR9481833.1 extensin [Burkholderia aenigmatica]MDN7513541.1 extensin [Burkholderia sp. AU45251]HDR9513360.1 extensin [Burkholderia aenigmatica]HDR9590204.1 extensin [Burkholderia aenigmatica]HDR9601811.1 extensin [Burkholderia aenigmatica]
MTSTRKTLMIAGGLLVAAAGTAYVMLLRADHRAIEDAGIGDSAAPVATAPASNDHAVQGTIAPPAPAAATAPKQAAVVPPTPAPAPDTTARVSAAPAPAVPVVSDKPQPVTKPSAPPPKVNVVTVDAQDSTPPAPPPAAKAVQQAAPAPAQVTQRAPRKRDGLERHAAAAPAATKSETPETAALVRESAKLDPSLPPPSMSSMSSSSSSYRQGSSSSGSNPVAAAMTEQLVRESSNFKTPAGGVAAGTK